MNTLCSECSKSALYEERSERYFCSNECHQNSHTPLVMGIREAGPFATPLVVSGNMMQELEKSNEALTVLYTDAHMQFALERVPEGDKIAREIHERQTQFIRAERGRATINIYYREDRGRLFKSFELVGGDTDSIVSPDWIVVHSNTYHEVVNTGQGPFLFYTIYAPRVH